MATNAGAPNPQTINQLLAKLTDPDPDFRFMSLNDIHQMLTKQKSDFLIHDFNTSSRIGDAIIKTLDDQNGEVQNLAVKCIGPLMTRIPISAFSPTIEKLTKVKIKHSVDNSLPSLALRSAVSALPKPVRGVAPTKEVVETYSIISRILIPRILGFPSNSTRESQGLLNPDGEPSAEAIDVLIEVVRCFGPMLQAVEVEKLQDVVVHVLEKKTTPSPVKKRAVVALTMLAPYLTDGILGGLIRKIQNALKQPNLDPVMRRLYITIMGSLARSIPHKFGDHLPSLIGYVLAALGQNELQRQLDAISEGDDQNPEFNEVREAAFVALDSFLASCGVQMRDFTDDTISSCLRYLRYDPNYAMDDDEVMDEDTDEDDDDDLDQDDEYEDDGGFDDDDDASWKVRRCAAKTLYTLISTRSNDLLDKGTLYQEVAGPLVKRFDEREESVRLEIISTMALLIRKTGEGVIRPGSVDDELLQSLGGNRKRRRQSSGGFALTNKAPYLGATGLTSPTSEMPPSTGPRADLSRLTPQLVKSSTKLLKGKQIASKQAIVSLLDDLILVQNGGLSDYFDQVMQPIIDLTTGSGGSAATTSVALSGGAASATATTLRVAVLHFTSDIARTHSSSLFQPYLDKIVTGIISAVRDRFYKISGEAIKTAEELVKAITPPRARLTSQKYKPQLMRLYDIIVDRASVNDVDTEVRQKAIQALGTLISRTSTSEGPALLPNDKRHKALGLLLDRLQNETTQLQAVRAIDNVSVHSVTPGSLDSDWIQYVTQELCKQLRKTKRTLSTASIQAMQHLLLSPATKGQLPPDTANGIIKAILPVISANDSHLLSPALLIIAQLQLENPALVSEPAFVKSICNILDKSIAGSTLDSLLVLVTNVGRTGMGQPLMKGVLDVGISGDPAVVGKIVGALFVASGGNAGVEIDSFINELKSTADPIRQCLSLAVLGEIGLRLGESSPLQPDIFLSQFHDEPDKVSVAAAVALGRAGAGNTPVYLPVILGAIKKSGTQQYLLLQAIREILHQVVISTSTDISAYEGAIWELLFSASQVEDNKAICAECIGRLAILKPKKYLPKLQDLQKSSSTAFRAVAVQALKYTLPDNDEQFDLMLKPVLVEMILIVLTDADREIRRLGMTTLNSAAHNKPDLILPRLGDLTPYVMKESVIKPELIREVQMGPFKHSVDDGLELRKSAYETLYALMDTAFSRISSIEFYDRIIAGLNDDNDIRALCNLMLSKLIVIDPDEITRRLDTIAECYRKTLSTKLKDNAVKQEVEKQDEANKGVLRVTLLLADKTKTTLPGASSVAGSGMGGQAQAQQPVQNPVWQQYWEWVNKDFERQIKALMDENREVGAS
ncbi:cullin binding protein CanA [Xylariomycetidae sp. FL2044]|nr:cullin binding protein CanA [Xylariomycetidae sp. FL2044]